MDHTEERYDGDSGSGGVSLKGRALRLCTDTACAVSMPWPGGIPQQEEINADGTAGGLLGLPLLQPLSRYTPPKPEVHVQRPVARMPVDAERMTVQPAGEGRVNEEELRQRQMQDILALVSDSNKLQSDMDLAKSLQEGGAAPPRPLPYAAPYAGAYAAPAPYRVVVPAPYYSGYGYAPANSEEEPGERGGERADTPAAPVRWADQDHAWAMRGKRKAPAPRPLTIDASVSYSRALEAAATAQEAAAFSPSAQVSLLHMPTLPPSTC
jgi:hypothetical protein